MQEHHDEILRFSRKLVRLSSEINSQRRSDIDKAEESQVRLGQRIGKLKTKIEQLRTSNREPTPTIPLFSNDSPANFSMGNFF